MLAGPHTGWGRVASSPFHALQHSPFLAWVSEVGDSLLTVTTCPLGTNSVIACWAQGAQAALGCPHCI